MTDYRKMEDAPMVVTPEERRLIQALRSNSWEATVVIKDRVPVMVRGFREDIKLTD